MTKPRLLIFGLDGASHGLLAGWMEAGHLPSLAEFARDAAVAPLRCTWPPHTATGWPTLLTGRLPGQHAMFSFWDCQASDCQLHAMPSYGLGCPILWDVFAAEGWTLGLLNIPMSHPPGSWPGYELTWPLIPTLRYSRPHSMLGELRRAGGLALPDIACMPDGSPGYLERAKRYVQERTKAVRYLIQNQPTDVLAVVYTEIDRICHLFWHGLDDNHPRSSEASGEDRRAISDIYSEIDNAFAEILELVDDSCVVMVVSDHGFGPGTRGMNVNQALAEGGFYSLGDRDMQTETVDVPRETLEMAKHLGAVEWDRTVAYMPTPGCFGVNLNLRGRQKLGVVADNNRKAVQSRIREYLLGLMDPDTNGAVFEAVLPAGVAYAGVYASRAPDLLLVPTDPSLMLLQNPFGPMWTNAAKTGAHRIEGVWMMRGPCAASGNRLGSMAIEAVANDVLTNLGLSSRLVPTVDKTKPANLATMAAGLSDGAWSVARDTATYWQPYDHSSPTVGTDSPDSSLPMPDTNERIVERLRALGYVD